VQRLGKRKLRVVAKRARARAGLVGAPERILCNDQPAAM